MTADRPVTRCRDARTDPDWWFEDRDHAIIERARNLCRWCPLAAACFERGWSEAEGMWGGVTRKERATISQLIGKAQLKARILRGRDYRWPALTR